MDSSTTPHSELLKKMLDGWNVKCFFRDAYVAGGSKICRPLNNKGHCQKLTNVSLKSEQENSMPQRAVYMNVECRWPLVLFRDKIWVKFPNILFVSH